MLIHHAIKDGLYNGLVLVMQLCLLVIATQVCTCYKRRTLQEKINNYHRAVSLITHEQNVSLSDENV